MGKRNIKKTVKFTLISLICILMIYLIVQGFMCNTAIKSGYDRLATYNSKNIPLSYGNMSYIDKGDGEVILSVHGIFGGYDQAYDTCKDLENEYRILAPSRFGYLGSDILKEGTPADQASAYVELLDELEIDKVYILATSAGGTVATRFALDYPERTKGQILYCSAPPLMEKPDSYVEYAGPPSFLCNNYAMWLMSPFFEPIMGMEPSTIYSMLPIDERKAGVHIDASLTNPDMSRNFDEYPIEDLEIPTLILHSKDDKLSSYDDMKQAVKRFPDCTFVSFENGGHLMSGYTKEIKEELHKFMND